MLTTCHPRRNELERQFLEMLQFNINVPSSVYAKYYFDLRTLAEANELSFPPEPLSKERAQKLEAMSQQFEDKVSQVRDKQRFRANSSPKSMNGEKGGSRTKMTIEYFLHVLVHTACFFIILFFIYTGVGNLDSVVP